MLAGVTVLAMMCLQTYAGNERAAADSRAALTAAADTSPGATQPATVPATPTALAAPARMDLRLYNPAFTTQFFCNRGGIIDVMCNTTIRNRNAIAPQ